MRASIICNRVTRRSSSLSSPPWSKATATTHCRSLSMVPKSKHEQNNDANANANANGNGTTAIIPENVIDVASSYMNNIRMKIATTLASSMTEQDRQQLFTSFNVTVNDEQQQQQQQQIKEKQQQEEKQKQYTMSVNEAVAQALAEEASKHKTLLEKERQRMMEQVMEQAEAAARKRVENDLLLRERQVALKKWEKELEEEKSMEMERESQQQELQEDDHNTQTQDDHDHHPILGRALIDFGYKRVHVISVKKLSAIPIWEKQRVYRHARAKLMAKDKLKTLDIGLPGVVALHEGLDGELSIIDGQHRVGMLAILDAKKAASASASASATTSATTSIKEDGNHQLNLDEILVEVFPQKPTSPPSHAQDLFVEINKAEPVKLVDMPGVAKKTDRKVINDAATYLSDTYPEMFKPSQRCRPPHLNIDNLRDAIFASGLLKKHNIKSKTALLKWILEKNAELGKKYAAGSEKGGGASASGLNKTALEKARKFNFYLGLDMTWLHQ